MSAIDELPKADRDQHELGEYREALEEIESVWIGESMKDEHLAALKMYTIAARVLNNADDAQEQTKR